MSMISGMLDKFGKSITIQRGTTVTGGYTGDTVTWATLTTCLAVVTPKSGRDAIMLQKIGLEADYKIYIDYSTAQEKDRILLDGKYYQIVWVQNPQSASEFLQVWVKGSDNIGDNNNQ